MSLWGVGRVLESWVMSGFVEDFQVERVKMENCREDEKYGENRVFWRSFGTNLGPLFIWSQKMV